MPRTRSAKGLQDLCVEAVAANLSNVTWTQLFQMGDAGNELHNPFEMLRNVKIFLFKALFDVLVMAFFYTCFIYSISNANFYYESCSDEYQPV